MLPRTMLQLFHTIDDNSSLSNGSVTSVVKVSMLEIYQEQLNDLLASDHKYNGNNSYNNHHSNISNNNSNSNSGIQPLMMTTTAAATAVRVSLKDMSSNNNKGLRIRENEDGQIWVEHLMEVVVKTCDAFMKLLSISMKRRVVGSHKMNQVSSRSHLLCIIHLSQLDFRSGIMIYGICMIYMLRSLYKVMVV